MSVDLKREPKHPFPTVTLAMWEESGDFLLGKGYVYPQTW
jgi:hypothetical protein